MHRVHPMHQSSSMTATVSGPSMPNCGSSACTSLPGDRRQTLDALGSTGRTLVDARFAVGHRLGITRAIGVAAACALRLGQGRVDAACEWIHVRHHRNENGSRGPHCVRLVDSAQAGPGSGGWLGRHRMAWPLARPQRAEVAALVTGALAAMASAAGAGAFGPRPWRVGFDSFGSRAACVAAGSAAVAGGQRAFDAGFGRFGRRLRPWRPARAWPRLNGGAAAAAADGLWPLALAALGRLALALRVRAWPPGLALRAGEPYLLGWRHWRRG